jgi:hypothetical protein
MTVVAAGQAATKLRHRTPEERRRARAAPPESETRTTPLRSSGCRSVVSMTENKDSDDVVDDSLTTTYVKRWLTTRNTLSKDVHK